MLITFWQLLTSKDLSFVGYTYKNFDAIKGLHQSGNSFIFKYLSLSYTGSELCST